MDAMLDLLFTSAIELIGDIKTRGCLGCSDLAVVEFTLLGIWDRWRVESGC